LDKEHVISQSMKALCKQRTDHKMKYIYTRTSPMYKFKHITYKSTFVTKTKYSYTRKIAWDQQYISKLQYCY